MTPLFAPIVSAWWALLRTCEFKIGIDFMELSIKVVSCDC